MSFLDLPIVSLLFKSSRSISTISGYITLSETTKDELEITQQPVQTGATITDHAFLKPTVLSMQIQFDRTNTLAALSSTLGSFIGNSIGGALGGVIGGVAGGLQAAIGAVNNDVLAQTYQILLTLQSSRQPFSISTPKRIYNSMLFQSLGLVTDKKTENVLSISATFQQIIIVNTAFATVDRINQKTPAKTGATTPAGDKSALYIQKQAVTNLFKSK